MAGYEYSTESRNRYVRVDLTDTGEEQDEVIWPPVEHLNHLHGVSADFMVPARRVLETRYKPPAVAASRCTEDGSS